MAVSVIEGISDGVGVSKGAGVSFTAGVSIGADADYLLLEDGVSRFELEDGSGFILLEQQ